MHQSKAKEFMRKSLLQMCPVNKLHCFIVMAGEKNDFFPYPETCFTALKASCSLAISSEPSNNLP